jgi:hypothetical protein
VRVDLSNIAGSTTYDTIIICDSPGFNDNRGYEQDIANGIGFINAITQAKTITLVVLTSVKS